MALPTDDELEVLHRREPTQVEDVAARPHVAGLRALAVGERCEAVLSVTASEAFHCVVTLRLLPDREAQLEGRALAGAGFAGDLAAVFLGDLLHHGQAETGAVLLA